MKLFTSTIQTLLAFTFFGLAACNPSVSIDGDAFAGEQKPEATYRSEPAMGVINSTQWQFQSGSAKLWYGDDSRISLNFYGESLEDPCAPFIYGKSSVITGVPAVVGETVLGQMPNIETATFAYSDATGTSANLIATEGRIAITSISDEEVSGFIIAKYDGANHINGSFRLKMCPR